MAVETIPALDNSPSYACSFRAEVCLLKGGHNKHFNTKDYLEIAEPNIKVKKMLQLVNLWNSSEEPQ